MKMSWRRHFPAGSLLLLWLGAMPAILPAVVAKATDGAGQKILDAMQSQASGAAAYKEGEVLVKFKRTMTRAEASLAAQDMDADVAREFPALSRLRQRTYVLITSGQRSTQQLLDGLRARPDVEAVSPNYRRRMQRLPNDPRWSLLWGLRMISAPDAWEINTGSAGVVLAVLDTGVDYRHKDLAANMWTNPGEIAGNGSDDDGNGYVDDIHGYDFAADNSGGVDGDPMDIDSHGSHVAGTIAAAGGNGEGVCGINWNARIMALKGFGPDGGIHDADSIRGDRIRGAHEKRVRGQPGGHQRFLRRSRRQLAAERRHRRRRRRGHRLCLRRRQ